MPANCARDHFVTVALIEVVLFAGFGSGVGVAAPDAVLFAFTAVTKLPPFFRSTVSVRTNNACAPDVRFPSEQAIADVLFFLVGEVHVPADVVTLTKLVPLGTAAL